MHTLNELCIKLHTRYTAVKPTYYSTMNNSNMVVARLFYKKKIIN